MAQTGNPEHKNFQDEKEMLLKQNENSYLLWADILKILSIYAVVLIHSAAPLLLDFNEPVQWWVGNLYDSLARWCIPVFFMLSGAFIMDKASEDGLSHFLFSRFRRIFLPFLIWSGLYFYVEDLYRG
jgi:surface polysaccharide O-acyltransferase-like enzyme